MILFLNIHNLSASHHRLNVSKRSTLLFVILFLFVAQVTFLLIERLTHMFISQLFLSVSSLCSCRFPFITSPLLRNQMYLNLICFVEEMVQILTEWDQKDYTKMFPETNPLPLQLFRYFVAQITDLREMEVSIGMQHEVRKDDEVFLQTQIFNSEDNTNTKSSMHSKKKDEEKNKANSHSYVVSK